MNSCVAYSPVTLGLIEQIEERKGRRLTRAPSWLKHTLYIPPHDNGTIHLPIYDVTERYQPMASLPVGSSLYKVALQMMKKPSGDGRDGDVRYLVDFLLTATPGALIRRRSLDGTNVEVDLNLASGSEPGFTIGATCGQVPVTTSFPIPPTIQGVLSSRNPYFTFNVPARTGSCQVQWQIHPTEHGIERYTLVRLGSKPGFAAPTPKSEGSSFNKENYSQSIIAIYHNIGVGLSLSQEGHEGVLMLPENNNPALEALIVASLLGMLRQMRLMPEGEGKRKETRTSSFIKTNTKSGIARWSLSKGFGRVCRIRRLIAK